MTIETLNKYFYKYQRSQQGLSHIAAQEVENGSCTEDKRALKNKNSKIQDYGTRPEIAN